MFASVLATWWNGEKKEDDAVVVVGQQTTEEVQAEAERRAVIDDDDGIFSSEDEGEADEEMVEIRKRFRAASGYLPSVTDRLRKDALLRMYGLYKAATVGKPTAADRPGMFDLKGRSKYAAWEAAAGDLTKKEAMRAYADELEDADVGFDPTATASTSGVGGGGFGMRMSRPVYAEGGDMNNGGGALVASPPSPSSMEWDMWVAAAKADDVDAIRRILERNPEILRKEEDVSGLTGIHWAADSGSLEVCRYLLGVDPSLIGELDTEGNEPMHLAALCGYWDVTEFLLNAGGSPTILNYERESAIDIAATPALKDLLRVRADQMEAAGRLLEDGTVVGRPQPPAELVHEEEHDDEVQEEEADHTDDDEVSLPEADQTDEGEEDEGEGAEGDEDQDQEDDETPSPQ